MDGRAARRGAAARLGRWADGRRYPRRRRGDVDGRARARGCIKSLTNRTDGAMNEALLISNVVLWIAVIALSAVVVALVRQIGVLHERVFPVGALVMPGGPKIGEAAPTLAVTDLAGRALRV